MSLKDLGLKVVKSPAVRKAVVGLVLAIAAALGVSLGTGCNGSMALPPEAAKAVSVALCVKAELDAAGDPEELTLGAARELADRLKACAEPAPAPVGDAG